MLNKITKEELESWLRQEYEKRPLNNAPLPGEVSTKQIIEILGVSDDIGKRFIKHYKKDNVTNVQRYCQE